MNNDLAAIVAQMRLLGITSYKTADFEIHLDDVPQAKPAIAERDLADEQSLQRKLERDRTDSILFGACSVRPRRPGK